MTDNLFNTVWDMHRVRTLPSGMDQLVIGLHLIHEVTSPQAFDMLRERGLSVRHPERTFATVDHIVPTANQERPFSDPMAEIMLEELENNTSEYGIKRFGLESGKQGIVHVIGPELGLTQPGMTIACGDSHTSTHGAMGAIAFGIGTSQIRDVLATQTLALSRPKVRRIQIDGKLDTGLYAKDIILSILARLGVNGGIGFAYEYGGETVHELSMEGRMTLCNMSIEGGARAGYINPDQTTFDYLEGRQYAPKGDTFERACEFWRSISSSDSSTYDDVVRIHTEEIEPMVTWGINPGQAMGVTQRVPKPCDLPEEQRDSARKACAHMGFEEGQALLGVPVDVVFIGSCTNGRLSDLRAAAAVLRGRQVAPDVRALVVPGSMQVAEEARREGLDKIFTEAGFDWRGAGCSMCLAMNPDRLEGRQLCASSSNRNFIGRQGSQTGRTMLMSPAMAAAAAVEGSITDVRDYL